MMDFRSLNRISGPAAEPLTVAEAKAHLRVDISDDDSYIAALITSAREYAESYLDRVLIASEMQMRLDGFPAEIELPRPPVIQSGTATAVAITYTLNDSQQTATLSAASYRVDRESTPAVVRPLYGGSWPSHLMDQNSVTVTWHAGYGATAASVPSVVKSALLMLIATWYERRLAADSVAATETPFGVKVLLDSVRWGAYR